VNTHAAGNRGETLACAYLQKCGAQIIARNVRLGRGEIDIIAREGDVILFIEVKSRSSLRFGTPAEAVHLQKQQRIIDAASRYMARHGLCDSPVRFDVIEHLNGKIRHIKGAFDASGMDV